MNYHEVKNVENILLTGATGVLGGRVLYELLNATKSNIYCLSRAESKEDALEGIEKMLFVYDTENKLREETGRIIPVLGDVAEPLLGLEQQKYDELASSIKLVFHSAASVSLIASYSKISPVNVDGTQRIVDFCLINNAPLLYFSSFSVIGDQLFHEIKFMEDDLDIGQNFEELDYERSKFEAERLIHEAGTNQDLSWAIVRPGNVWGDSKTGAYPFFETKVKGIYYEMIKALVETGYSFPSSEDFDISPVDYVAEASVYIAMNIQKTNRNTYHLTNPDPCTYDDILDNLKSYGYVMRVVSNDEYFEALYEDRLVRNGEIYQSTFTDLIGIMADEEDLEELAKYDTSKAQALLEPAGIVCPRPNIDLMRVYLDNAVSRGLINSPDNQQPLAEITEEMENKIFMQNLYDDDFEPSGVV